MTRFLVATIQSIQMAMREAQPFDWMTYDEKDVRMISDFVIKRIHRETLNGNDTGYLQEEIEEFTEEVECLQERFLAPPHSVVRVVVETHSF